MQSTATTSLCFGLLGHALTQALRYFDVLHSCHVSTEIFCLSPEFLRCKSATGQLTGSERGAILMFVAIAYCQMWNCFIGAVIDFKDFPFTIGFACCLNKYVSNV